MRAYSPPAISASSSALEVVEHVFESRAIGAEIPLGAVGLSLAFAFLIGVGLFAVNLWRRRRSEFSALASCDLDEPRKERSSGRLTRKGSRVGKRGPATVGTQALEPVLSSEFA